MRHLANIYRLGVKELWSLARDPMMLILIFVSFTLMIYTAATAVPETLHNAPIAVVDEDVSPCRRASSRRSIRPTSRRRS